MKKISTLLSLVLMIVAYNSQAQTTYTVSANTSWNGTYPTSCTSCTFNISTGVTLTIDKNITCNTCTFNGGKISITQDVVCQPCTFSSNTISLNNKELKPNSSTTSFSSVNFSASGSADILANTAVNITNSTFTFNNTSFFKNNGGQLAMSASTMNFYDDAYFLANAGPVNLSTTSHLVAGNGTLSSTAYIKMNGPTLNIYDNSSISIKNKNNSYFNWGSYNSPTNGASYSTASNTMNCGGANPHACSAPNVYGCATLNSSGASACSILPVSMNDFSAAYTSNTVELSWSTSEEINFDHFVIERSTDAGNWQSIGTVYSKYSSTGNTYHFTDSYPLSNTSYYRLQIADKDGKISYTKIISVNNESNTNQVSIFPNPVTNLTFNVKLPSTAAAIVNVFTIEGRILFITSLQGQTQYQVKLPASASSTNYLIVQIISNGKTHTFNILNKK
jgi:hypothetical protein